MSTISEIRIDEDVEHEDEITYNIDPLQTDIGDLIFMFKVIICLQEKERENLKYIILLIKLLHYILHFK